MDVNRTMSKRRVWMRMGDSDEYHYYDSPFDAGYDLGGHLSETGTEEFKASDISWRNMGLEVDGFTGYNYVSLFWGDDDAQNPRELSSRDKAQFVVGVRDGGYFHEKPKSARKSAKPKSHKRDMGTPSVRGLRR